MKKTFTVLIMICGLFSFANAQTALDPLQFVNTQITGPGVYTLEAGQSYAFDGRIDLDFEITIQGPDEGWIMEAANPPILVNTPSADGTARNFFELKEGGGLTIKNAILSGVHNNGERVKIFAANTGGSKMIVDNCVMTDWLDFAFRNQNKGDTLSVTNSVFINGVRLGYSQWGGFPVRMDVACDNVIFENNTVVNSGRLLANSGPFENAAVHQIHNTYLNQAVAGEEQRANEFITANNIFYNFHFLGRTTENHSNEGDNEYGSYFTTWNYFADSKDNLDSISLYLGQNLFYRPQEVLDWFDTNAGDSLALSLLWERPDVDSFILTDNNYTIGTNYAEMDPGFTTPPGNSTEVVDFINGHRNSFGDNWADWRIPSPVTFNEDGTTALSWPPAFDLSYSNTYLQTAGTDGLPLGDLNWFPTQKAEYLAGKDGFIEAIRDSMINAVAVYDPETMDTTPLITMAPFSSSIEKVDPIQLHSTGNYPNPFNQITTIKFGLKQQSDVTLTVFDLVGKKVFESNKGALVPGSYEFNFDGSNLSSGTYFYKINAIGKNGQNYVTSKKMLLSK